MRQFCPYCTRCPVCSHFHSIPYSLHSHNGLVTGERAQSFGENTLALCQQPCHDQLMHDGARSCPNPSNSHPLLPSNARIRQSFAICGQRGPCQIVKFSEGLGPPTAYYPAPRRKDTTQVGLPSAAAARRAADFRQNACLAATWQAPFKADDRRAGDKIPLRDVDERQAKFS